jgi:hypothetical protein
MNDSNRDPMLDRAIEELKRLPAVDPQAVRRVIGVAATARVTAADEPVADEGSVTSRRTRVWSVAAVAAAAAIVGFVVRGAWLPDWPAVRPASVATAPLLRSPSADESVKAALQPVADVAGVKPLLHQFVLQNKKASRVSVVGDFNQWNTSSAPMTRSADGAIWSVLIPILPGRHVYAFMVDDSLLTLDPTTATARDPDLGTNASVVMVGRP